ncbi:hypothetical protein BAUCODRAFT_73625 [Baudoinia panamericana UAMH 10762]|uniref:Uncharacterized protein n=1 Tax=Baudoinia panamericana (strain UAMH 10762) TaxID=717646 RepID=M2MCS6_BAUPA|nr:uncharacterized protein BAUCODRAFT_73625 [Baudoinia panamericana UAMH 10762]EMC94346.1 hypothetical protein BAUCODRAFT_73625 [Baudoinia panamericana UAMH 10762]
MKDHLSSNIYARELRDQAVRSRSYRKLYSDRRLIADLDIVNELDGHSGCVNALSWSKSGKLLASGSDDQHLNIHTYQPSTSTSQFQLTTTVATGHTQNIFSVKFMPHHNDRTVITAAGDGEVRVFDLEYAGQSREASAASAFASEGRRRGRNTIYNGVRYLSDGDTDCRVYRSHGDRVKRIVTESSPHLFLTCSEDGEVRQWDLRQPSSAYPPPRSRHSTEPDSSVPPPLISYKRYNLDLNSISCSPSQPHYIALGGAHLHAFLHDRRMTGRDRLREAGKPLSPLRSMSAEDQELMRQATQCVRKFAPKGQQRMGRTENGHITALKISDARPDEMVVSWSGDHIYSFDLVRSPDATEGDAAAATTKAGASARVKESKDRKRKRSNLSSQSTGQQNVATRGSSRSRTEQEGAALRVRYQNGQSEDIPLPSQTRSGLHALTEKQREAQRIATTTVKIRSALFGAREEGKDATAQFTTALGEAASIMADIDEVLREWRYPMEPSAEMVVVERTLRSHRESTRRFVQASGTVARVLGGRLRTASSTPSPLLGHFTSVEVRTNDLPLERQEQFGYDFLKAILLWLESGIGRLIDGFTRPASMPLDFKGAQRLPIPHHEATTEAIDEYLIPYLLRIASDKPIVNVEANRFETDENRRVFPSEKAAVLAFAAAVRIPFADLSSAVVLAEGSERIQAQDRTVAMGFWGLKVARGVLLNAAEGVNFIFVDRAFGGVGRVVREEPSDVLTEMEEGHARPATVEPAGDDDDETYVMNDDDDDEDTAMLEDDNDDDDEDDEDDNDVENHDDEDSSEPDEIDGVPNLHALPHFMFTSAFERRRRKEKVELSVPCHPSTRVYRGHCNVRTVKDVNFFGLDDEFVVSGSDDGNFFLWDRKTAELVNVLEGDGEVVNVVQGHPFETVLAVSGIDHTIKIFSPDGRARAKARRGDGVSAHDEKEDDEDDEYVAPTGLPSRKRMHDAYRIMNKNDVERQGGNQDSYLTVRELRSLMFMLSRGWGGAVLAT